MTIATSVQIPVNSIRLEPGSTLTIADVSWEQFEAILGALGEDRRIPRIAYCHGILELVSPLPAHERPNRIIGYLVTSLLDAQNRDWDDFGSTTFWKPTTAGLEPDTCFYIQSAQQVRDCMGRMDLNVYPPPDLAIEADVTSKTTLEAYTAMQIPELWIYNREQLTIYLFQDGQYRLSTNSAVFPDLPIKDLIPQWVERALQEGTSKVLRELRQQTII